MTYARLMTATIKAPLRLSFTQGYVLTAVTCFLPPLYIGFPGFFNITRQRGPNTGPCLAVSGV